MCIAHTPRVSSVIFTFMGKHADTTGTGFQMDIFTQNAKAWASLVFGIATALTAVYPPDQFKWLAVVIAVSGAIVTWAVPNKPSGVSE